MTTGRAINNQIINQTQDMVCIPNIQFAYIAVWYSGEKDFFSFTSEAKFKAHIEQWNHNEGSIIWRSDRIVMSERERAVGRRESLREALDNESC